VITDQEQLSHLLARLQSAEWIALDTEADSLHSYPEKLCLIQLSIPGADELVDPLAGLDLEPLMNVLRPRELIAHGADYDLRLLHRSFQFVPSTLFDTMLAARFLGLTAYSLSDLVKQYLGITLEKGSQKANWSLRPLSKRRLAYARNDTAHLHPLAECLRAELQQKNRLDWHREACLRLIADSTRPNHRDPNLVWRLGGSERLSRPALAVLRSLWHWREQEAIQQNQPVFFILSHSALRDLAGAAVDGSSWEHLLPKRFSPGRRRSLSDALARGLAVAPSQQPDQVRPVRIRFSEAEHKRLRGLFSRRDHRAKQLGLDASFIASRTTLIALARNDPELRLMNWQRELLLAPS
jgi:ribonuclease D